MAIVEKAKVVHNQCCEEHTTLDSQEEQSRTESPTQPHSLLYEIMFITLISTAQFATQAGIGQTLAILHIIGDDLGVTDPAQLSWLMASYSLTVGTFILPSGRLGDLFGSKKMYIIGLVWFAVFSLTAGLSVYSGKFLFIFARALQGIGAAVCLPNAIAILGNAYSSGKKKTMMFSIFGATAPVGSVAGALFASLFAKASWPWTFYSFTIVLLVTAVLVAFLVPEPPRKEQVDHTRLQYLEKLDPLGSTTGVLSLILISFAFNQAPVVGWTEPYTYAALIVGLLLAPLFIYIELRIASAPIIPFACISGDVALVLVCVACGWSCFGIFLYYIWQFFELLRGASPLLATAWYTTNGVSGVVAAVLTGLFLDRVGPARAMVLALLAFVVGSILIATAPVGQTYWAQSFLCLLIIPFGMDISFPAASVIVSDLVGADHQGMGGSLVNVIVNWSVSMGLGLAGNVEVHVNRGGETRDDLLLGYRGAWYMGIGLSSLGLVTACCFVFKQARASGREEQRRCCSSL